MGQVQGSISGTGFDPSPLGNVLGSLPALQKFSELNRFDQKCNSE